MAETQQQGPQMSQGGSILNFLSDIITKQATAGQGQRDPNAMIGAPQGLPQAKQNVQVPAIAVPMLLQSILAPLMGGQGAGAEGAGRGVAKPNDTAPAPKPAGGGGAGGGDGTGGKKTSPLEMIHGVISMLASLGG